MSLRVLGHLRIISHHLVPFGPKFASTYRLPPLRDTNMTHGYTYDWPEVQPPPRIYKRMEDRITVLYHELEVEQKANTALRAEAARSHDDISKLETDIESWKMVERILVNERDHEKRLRRDRDAEIERLRKESEESLRELSLARENARRAQARYDRALGRLDLVFGEIVFKVVNEGEEYMDM